jgi:hypothetical protein
MVLVVVVVVEVVVVAATETCRILLTHFLTV